MVLEPNTSFVWRQFLKDKAAEVLSTLALIPRCVTLSRKTLDNLNPKTENLNPVKRDVQHGRNILVSTLEFMGYFFHKPRARTLIVL